jgi:hypothetical protein
MATELSAMKFSTTLEMSKIKLSYTNKSLSSSRLRSQISISTSAQRAKNKRSLIGIAFRNSLHHKEYQISEVKY